MFVPMTCLGWTSVGVLYVWFESPSGNAWKRSFSMVHIRFKAIVGSIRTLSFQRLSRFPTTFSASDDWVALKIFYARFGLGIRSFQTQTQRYLCRTEIRPSPIATDPSHILCSTVDGLLTQSNHFDERLILDCLPMNFPIVAISMVASMCVSVCGAVWE